MSAPLTRREEAMLEAWWRAFLAEYLEATRKGKVGGLLLIATLGESGAGLSVGRHAKIRHENEVRLGMVDDGLNVTTIVGVRNAR